MSEPNAPSSGDEQAIRWLENETFEAILKKDAGALSRLLAE